MQIKKVIILNKSGLHARPAADFVGAAGKFKSRISIRRVGAEGEEVNAKSIVMLLSLALAQGEEAELIAKGDDEEAAVEQLSALIAGGFGEL